MSIASLLSIKITSPITHMVSSAARGVVVSLLGVWFFKDIISTYVSSWRLLVACSQYCSGRASSIATILLGSVFYTWVKHQETEAAKQSYDRVPLEEIEEGKGNMSPTKRSRSPSD